MKDTAIHQGLNVMSAKSEQKLELKKHINLIHCSNKFSLVQRKLFNALLFNAYPELTTNDQFIISAKKLCEMIGYKSKDIKNLKKSLLGLITTAVEWNVIDEGNISKEGNKWRASSAISSARLEKGTCIYEYSTVMKELFYQPEIYGRINISLLPKFKSSYGLALYENCVRYQGVPQTPWFNMDIFRKLMGVEENKYDAFGDFKKRILDIAIKEVNSHSSLIIKSEVKKIHQKVIGIRFLIDLKENRSLAPKNNVFKDKNIEDALVNSFGLKPKTVENVFEKYELSYIKEKINIILNSNSFRSGKIENPAAYLTKALKENFTNEKTNFHSTNEERKKAEEAIAFAKEKNEKLQLCYKKYVASIMNEYMLSLSPAAYKKLMDDFEVSIKAEPGIVYNWFRKEKLEHPAVKAMFNNYVREKQLIEFDGFLSFDDFQKLLPKEE